MSRVRIEEKFAMLPEWLLFAEVSAQAIRVYAVLAREAGGRDKAFVSHKRIAQRAACSVATARRALDDLAELGAIEVAAKSDRTGRTFNEYLVRVSRPLLMGEQAPLIMDEQTSSLTDEQVPLPTGEQGKALDLERKPLREGEVLPTPRKRDVIADALALAEGSDPLEVPASRMRTLCVKANELRRVAPDVAPADVAFRAARWESHFGDATITGPAIVTHWARLRKPGPGRRQRGETPLGRHARELVEGVNHARDNGGRRPSDEPALALPRVADR